VAITAVVVVVPIVMVTVVFVVPMTFMVFPTPVIVVVVRMAPIRTLIGRPAPYSGNPHISGPGPVPVPISPNIARTRNGRPNLIAQRRRIDANIDADLSEGWSCDC
jgi:hypothetical protein